MKLSQITLEKSRIRIGKIKTKDGTLIDLTCADSLEAIGNYIIICKGSYRLMLPSHGILFMEPLEQSESIQTDPVEASVKESEAKNGATKEKPVDPPKRRRGRAKGSKNRIRKASKAD